MDSWPVTVYSQPPPLGPFFHPFHPERLRLATKGPALPLPTTGKPEIASLSSDFSDTSLPLPPSAGLVPLRSGAYPADTGRASIRRTMLPNRRRVRWLSANSR
jgi:hypothetical protein